MQQEIHNPVKVICRIKEFTWNMVKLVIIFNDTMSKEGSHLINYHRLMSGLKINENDEKCYQGFQLKNFERATLSVWKMLRKGLVTSKSHESWKPLLSILDTFTWLVKGDCSVLAMMLSKKSVSILRSLLLRANVISQKLLVSDLC